MKNKSLDSTKCTVNINVGKVRVRNYDNTVYLKHNQNFELEFFNPHNVQVLAKISINGRSNTSIIIKPGYHVYLDRDIDNEKLLFKANTVAPSIEISFYKESISLDYYASPAWHTTIINGVGKPIGSTSAYFCNTSGIKSSNQTPTGVYGNFNMFHAEHVRINLLPKTAKLRVYCLSCGIKIKNKSWQFCPNCGTSLK